MRRLDLEGQPFIQAIVRDVTKRKHANAVLLETKKLMAAIVESIKVAVFEIFKCSRMSRIASLVPEVT